MIEIKFTFETIEEAAYFLNSRKEQQQQVKPKKENDGRGRSTKDFHKLCKSYHEQHPEKTYRECLQELKNLNKNTIETP